MGVCKHGYDVLDSRVFLRIIYKSNSARFPCLHSLGGLGEFSKVMQTRDVVDGLHNCVEFSQPSSCLGEAM